MAMNLTEFGAIVATLVVNAEGDEVETSPHLVYELSNHGADAVYFTVNGSKPKCDSGEQVGEGGILGISSAFTAVKHVVGCGKINLACAAGKSSVVVITRADVVSRLA